MGTNTQKMLGRIIGGLFLAGLRSVTAEFCVTLAEPADLLDGDRARRPARGAVVSEAW